MDVLTYIFWPNPGNASYDNPKILILLGVCALLVVLSFVLRAWRKRMTNAVSRKLSRSWPSAAFWFGLTGLVMTVSRVEGIQYLSMRFLWIVWAALALLFAAFQFRNFRMRYYEVLPTQTVSDPRAKYLPKQKRK